MVYQTDLETKFRALLEHAIKAGAEWVRELDDDVQRHLSEITRREPELVPLIRGYPFDAVGFYGDESTARNFLEYGTPHFKPKKMGALFEGSPTEGDFRKWNLDAEAEQTSRE